MKKILLTAALIFTSLFLSAQEKDNGNIVKTGDMVPDFKVKMFDGKETDIKALKGKVVLINFWATWCPSCIQELAVVQKEIIDRFAGKEFVFLPVSREDTYEKIAAFRKARGHNFPMGMDTDRSVYSKFAKISIPRNYVVDKTGKIVHMDIGYTPAQFKEMIEVIEKLLK